MRKFIQATIFLVATIMASSAFADIKVAVVYDMGGKFDKSFNEGVYNGAKRFSDETGIKLMEFEVTNETQREQGIRRMAQKGANVVVCVGFAQADSCDKVAKEFPDTKFSIIDVGGDVDATVGDSTVLNGRVTGENITFQWYKNGDAIDGATSASLDLGSVQTGNSGTYKMIATDAAACIDSASYKNA